MPVALFALVTLASGAAGVLSYMARSEELHTEKERELAAIAALKVEEIERWRAERIADAEAISLHPAPRAAVQGAPDAASPAQPNLDRWFESIRSLGEYSAATLVDREGRIRCAVGPPMHELEDVPMHALVSRAVAEDRAVLSDVHRHGPRDALHLNLVAPIRSPGGHPIGAAVLRVDPYRYLYRMIQAWPGPSASAETMLVRAEGGRVAFVNELRHWTDDPAALEVPIDGPDPAARAAAGSAGVVEGTDYRGKRVLAAIQVVPHSPWTLVAKVDVDEAFAPLAERRLWAIASVAALVLAVGFAAWLWWRMQAADLERQRLRNEAERSALARKLEHVTEYALDIIFVADEAWTIVEVNDRALALLGYARDELLGQSLRVLRDPETIADFDDRAREVVERGGIAFETRCRRKNGTTFPVDLSLSVDELDGRRWFQGIAHDITERKRAEAALVASEAKFRAAFEGAGVGMVLVDGEGRHLETNRAIRRMLGYSEAGLRAMRVWDLVEGDDTATRAVVAGLRDGRTSTFEHARRYRRRDGSVADVIVRATALRDAGGAFQYALGVVEDVSEKKRIEAQLLLADRMASLGTLAAGVAHEINNPLAFVLANVDFSLAELVRAGASAEVVRALQEARDGGVRVRDIVRDLKTFSRADDEAKEPVDVRRVLRSSLALAASELRHRAQVDLALSPAPPVLASKHRLGQVLLNLLINAAQAIPEGRSGEHRIRASTGTAADGRAVVEIADTGCGIPPEVLPRIFDPFFTTKPVGIGTGLGLAICHSIVTAHGGEIAVDTDVGRGSTFRVLLPSTETPAGPEVEPAPTPVPAQRARILVVDDEPLVGRAVQRILAPHEVVACTSGAAALAQLSRASFDLVLCDLMMPDMTGIELHARLAAKAPDVARRMVFLTGGAFTVEARAFLAEIPNARLEKPFEPAALRAVVACALPGAPQA
jgi:PAS domain S-box-containing protein